MISNWPYLNLSSSNALTWQAVTDSNTLEWPPYHLPGIILLILGQHTNPMKNRALQNRFTSMQTRSSLALDRAFQVSGSHHCLDKSFVYIYEMRSLKNPTTPVIFKLMVKIHQLLQLLCSVFLSLTKTCQYIRKIWRYDRNFKEERWRKILKSRR